MSRALMAAFRSQVAALIERCRLEHNEVTRIAADLVVEYGRKSGFDRPALHALVDDEIDLGGDDMRRRE